MKPIHTPDTNVTLTLNDYETGERLPDCDLPAERAQDQDGRFLLETTWEPEPGERRAIANGAPVILRVWGTGHPPVQMLAGEPDENQLQALIDRGHVTRAIGHLYGQISDQFEADRKAGALVIKSDGTSLAPPTAPEFLTMWEQALAATNEPPSDGASHEDVAANLRNGFELDTEGWTGDTPDSDTPPSPTTDPEETP